MNRLVKGLVFTVLFMSSLMHETLLALLTYEQHKTYPILTHMSPSNLVGDEPKDFEHV